jgi:UDP-N-acetylmuramate--alanine ligase
MVEENTHKQLLRDIAQVEREYPLAQVHAAAVGGRAAYFTEAHDAMELAAAVKAAIDAKLPYEIVGAGTSVLFPDDGYAGLVIANRAEGFIMATDRSQVVVESGMSLQRFITMAAGRGYGGMTQFYGQLGTVGGAVYHNLQAADGSMVLSFVRHLTMLMPPTKMKPYPTVVRQRGDWLKREDGQTKLQYSRAQRDFGVPYPVVLNVQFQLTSVRPDELQRRIQRETQFTEKRPKGTVFGPVFLEPGGEHSLSEILRLSGVNRLPGPVTPDKRQPNYVRLGKGASAMAIWDCACAMRQLVQDRAGIELIFHFERLGVW